MRVHNRFSGMAGSAFFDGRDAGYTIASYCASSEMYLESLPDIGAFL